MYGRYLRSMDRPAHVSIFRSGRSCEVDLVLDRKKITVTRFLPRSTDSNYSRITGEQYDPHLSTVDEARHRAAASTVLTAPAFAQSYISSMGTGNVINMTLAEATNGALGVGASDYGPVSGASSAYAYLPRGRTGKHRHVHRHYSR